jgi:hypothetical protein
LNCFAQTINWQLTTIKGITNEYRKAAHYYSNLKALSMQMTYTSFKSPTSTEVADKSVGFFKKDKSNYHSYFMGIRTIQNNKYKFTINEFSKMIMVWNKDTTAYSIVDLDEKKLDSSLIISIKIAHLTEETRIRIDYKKNIEIQTIEYSISKFGYIKEIILNYCRNFVNDQGENELTYPRLNISFSDINAKYIANRDEFDESKYFFEKDSILQLKPLYQTYKLRDYRKK